MQTHPGKLTGVDLHSLACRDGSRRPRCSVPLSGGFPGPLAPARSRPAPSAHPARGDAGMDRPDGPLATRWIPEEEERWQAADETLATLDRRIAERAAYLKKLATSRADFLRLLRADRKLEQLKLEHGIAYWRLPEERRARHLFEFYIVLDNVSDGRIDDFERHFRSELFVTLQLAALHGVADRILDRAL